MEKIQEGNPANWRGILKKYLKKSSPSTDLVAVELDAAPLLLLRTSEEAGTPLLVAAADLATAEILAMELEALARELRHPRNILLLPENARGKLLLPAGEAARARAIDRLRKEKVDIVVGSVHALLSPVPPPDSPGGTAFELCVGQEIAFLALLERFVALDYDDEFEVGVPGEFARRGGIVDVFSPAMEFPCRIEFFGDRIESIREFDPATQRSLRPIEACRIIAPHPSACVPEGTYDFFSLQENASFNWAILHPGAARQSLADYASTEVLHRFDRLVLTFAETGRLRLFHDSAASAEFPDLPFPDTIPSLAGLIDSDTPELRASSLELSRALLLGQLKSHLGAGYRVVLLADAELNLTHLKTFLREQHLESPLLTVEIGNIGAGFTLRDEKVLILTARELFSLSASHTGMKSVSTQETSAPARSPEEVFTDLDEGDYAVHIVHGVGIFRGLRELENKGSRREVMVLEYRDGALLYVPLMQSHQVSRYFGHPGKVKLNTLGSTRWSKAKEEAKKAVRDYAADLLRLQAVRQAVPGIPLGEDTLEMKLFESEFPYADTPDQTRATEEIKRDMARPRPMDRLLCGDVGYGKTELAMRAAFKAVSAGFQVAVLAPTTVLVQQHLQSFRARFAAHPYVIDSLSRFRTDAEQRQVVNALRTGGVDIVIGTHRLASLGAADFKNLGLLVIDEEQRFGVRHKEDLRRLRTEVDVLTMSATPIPRTLYLAMAGTRDLSTLMTAPRERRPVSTIIAQEEDALVAAALKAEFARGGQAYYLHNRVRTIERKAEKLRALLPGARFGVAHGQMAEGELEQMMTAFLEHKIDCLVCSTIIESGLDIPNANTILIERADRFGLAELYQLRGRVGRWKHQAYAYMLLPPDMVLAGDARKRIMAIRRCSQLGASFQLAMRDLEIRGAGNLLGAEQSGHLNTIGFELYCRLLKEETARLKNQAFEFLPEVEIAIDFITFAYRPQTGFLPAALPPDYIVGERLRVGAYRKLAALASEAGLEAFTEELTDRFGPPPEAVKHLLSLTLLRILAARAGYTRLSVMAGRVLLQDDRRTFRIKGTIPVIDYRNPPELRLLLLRDILRGALKEVEK